MLRDSGLGLAKVTKIHPEAHAVDLVLLKDGSRVPMVQVLSQSASTNSGRHDLAEPTATGEDFDPTETKDRDIYAVCGFIGGLPVVLGFLFPQVCQMLFADLNRRVDRHASDVYTTIDAAGNMELYHPSGTYLRIASDSAHEDLTGKDFDGKFKIEKNTTAAVHVHLAVANAGTPVASIDIDPSGNIVEQNNGNVTANIGGSVNATVGGSIFVTAGSDITLQSPTRITLDTPITYITGVVSVENSHGASGNTATFNGPVEILQGDLTVDVGHIKAVANDVIATTVSLQHHVHTGVTPGGGDTGQPVP